MLFMSRLAQQLTSLRSMSDFDTPLDPATQIDPATQLDHANDINFISANDNGDCTSEPGRPDEVRSLSA